MLRRDTAVLAVAAVTTLALGACSASSPAQRPMSTSNAPTSRPAVRSAAPASPTTTRTAGPSTRAASTRAASSASARPSTTAAGQRFAGTTVVLNPGHNGGNAEHPDEINRLVPAGYGDRKACDTTGTETDAGYPEHAFTWDLALRIRSILRGHGIRVLLTRHSDHGVGPCVDRRAEIGNAPDVAAVVSLHADGGPADGRGFHVNQDSKRPDGASARVAHESIQLGRAIHRTLVASSGLVPSTYIRQDAYVYRTDFAGLDLATRPATFLELGNMRNASDAAKLSSTAGRQRIAVAVADGILAFLAAH